MESKNEINLNELFKKIHYLYKYLLKKWVTIVIFLIIGAASGIIYSFVSKTSYKSTLTFVVEGDASGGGLASLASSFLGKADPRQGVFNSANMQVLLKSRLLIQKALLEPIKSNPKKSFADLYATAEGFNKTWDKIPEMKNLHFSPHTDPKNLSLYQNKAMGQLYLDIITNSLVVENKDPDNSIIYIELESHSNQFSRFFPEELIDVTSKYYVEYKTKKAKMNYQALQKQTDSVRIELNNAISGVASANDNTFLLNPAFNIKRVPSATKEVNVEANQIILGELVKNLEISRMNLLNETPIIQIIDTPISPLKGVEFGKIKGIILGAFLGGFLIIAYLVIVDFFKTFNQTGKE